MIHIIFNAFWEQLAFESPAVAERFQGSWKRWIDTSLEPPADICTWDEAAAVEENLLTVQPRCVVVLVARMRDEG